MQFLLNLFGANGLIPHGYCLTWSSSLLWLNVLSDSFIVLAYYSIPVTLVRLVRQRKDLPYPWLFTIFGLFIVACGTTHLFSVITVWLPLYWLDGIVKAITAVISVVAALLMIKVIPYALMLRSPAQLELEIQEKNQTQIALQKALDRLHRIASCVPGVVYQFMQRPDGSYCFPYASEAIREIYRVSPADVQEDASKIFTILHEDDYDKIIASIQASAEQLTPWQLEFRVNFGGGDIHWLFGDALPQKEEDGSVLWHGFITDITGRKQAEDALRIAAATFNTHEAIMITDADGTILRVNQAFQKITGYSADEVIGKTPRVLSSGRHDKNFYAEMWQRLLTTGAWEGEILDRRKNGQIYPKWLTITALKNPQGKTTEYVALFNDITERKQAENEIRNLAFYDALTKLPNRHLLLDRFNLALSASERSKQYGALLFLDMDNFKTLNDTLGHNFGDLMLIEVAQRIKFSVRETDIVARFGGDEFVVLLENLDINTEDASRKAALVAEKTRAALAVPYYIKGHVHHSSPSIGVCLYRGLAVPVDDLIKYADTAMYQAKNTGRNTVRFYDPVLQQAVESRAALESDLRSALISQQLRLYYQIQVDSKGLPFGAEALLRWIHPERGLISPQQFIPIAEESSLILEIGQWVLEKACLQLAEWSKSDAARNLLLAINVSAHQLMMPNFVASTQAVIQAHNIDPSRLKLELTESVILTNIEDVIAKMQALKAIGIKLSLDDFGTGYSSLAYLKRLPIDQIKIDQGFVRDIVSNPSDAVIVKTIIDMAKNFHLDVIAEGVETAEQLDFLQQNGCIAFQGYFFGEPMPIEQFEALLKKY